MTVYRIVSKKHSKKLTASGFAARWNSNGIYMIYTASSISLACLENIVHRNKAELNMPFDLVTIHIPDELKNTKLNSSTLPKGWDETGEDGYRKCVPIGDKWIKDCATPVLEVPSVITKIEHNLLINPNHADFTKVKITEIEPFFFDPRVKN